MLPFLNCKYYTNLFISPFERKARTFRLIYVDISPTNNHLTG